MTLLIFQVKNDLNQKYSGSFLGLYWSLMAPLLQVLVYVFLFSIVFNIKLGGTSSPVAYAIFCLSGLGAWFAVQEAIMVSTTCMSKNSSIIKNINFPSYIFVISSVICSFLVILAAYFVLLLLIIIVEHRLPGITVLAIPFILIVHFVFVLGLGMILSVIGAFFKDITYVLPVLMQLLMLTTPILYKRSDVPKAFQIISDFNPIYYLIDAYRSILYLNVWPNWFALLGLLTLGLILCFLGWRMYNFVKGILEAIV